MTEAEWLACATPEPMWAWVKKRGMDRKFLLFACACARRFWPLLDDKQRHVVEILEDSADAVWRTGWQDAEKIAKTEAMRCHHFSDETRDQALLWFALSCASQVATYGGYLFGATDYLCIVHGYQQGDDARYEQGKKQEKREQARLAREVFGNPFHTFDLEPYRSACSNLAQTIHAERRFELMPILADALEEAGCTDTAILTHCREKREHVRGCWVLDLLLGKQ